MVFAAEIPCSAQSLGCAGHCCDPSSKSYRVRKNRDLARTLAPKPTGFSSNSVENRALKTLQGPSTATYLPDQDLSAILLWISAFFWIELLISRSRNFPITKNKPGKSARRRSTRLPEVWILDFASADKESGFLSRLSVQKFSIRVCRIAQTRF